MSWLDQGRQDHGWFGHGRSGDAASDADGLFDPAKGGERIAHAVDCLTQLMPAGSRTYWPSAIEQTRPEQLDAAFAGWYAASALGSDAFAELVVPPQTSGETVSALQAAARDILGAQDAAQLERGAEALASAAFSVGPAGWPRSSPGRRNGRTGRCQRATCRTSRGFRPGTRLPSQALGS